MATEAWRHNNIMARLRVARDKYFGGYAVGGDIGAGTIMYAYQINNIAAWCTEVTNRSPLRYTYATVGVGQLVTVGPLDTNYNQINAVANCYGNCHSNCYSDCNCNCDSYSHSCADGK